MVCTWLLIVKRWRKITLLLISEKKMKIQKTPCFSSPGIIVPAFLLTKNFKFLTHNVFAINFVGVLMERSPFEQNYWNYLLFNWIKLFRRRNIKNTLLIPTRNNYISLFLDKQWIDCCWDTCHLNIFWKFAVKFRTHTVLALNFVGMLIERSPFEQNHWNYL